MLGYCGSVHQSIWLPISKDESFIWEQRMQTFEAPDNRDTGWVGSLSEITCTGSAARTAATVHTKCVLPWGWFMKLRISSGYLTFLECVVQTLVSSFKMPVLVQEVCRRPKDVHFLLSWIECRSFLRPTHSALKEYRTTTRPSRRPATHRMASFTHQILFWWYFDV